MKKERKETISLGWANLLSVVLMLLSAVIYGGLMYLSGWSPDSLLDAWKNSVIVPIVAMFAFFAVTIVGLAVHELIHGIFWAHYAENGWKSIRFGVIWKALTPYCHCDVPLLKRHYVIGALTPLIILGVIPGLLAPVVGSFAMLVFGIVFTGGAAGDVMVIWRLRKERSDVMVLDHPTEAGYLVYEDEEEN